MKITLDISQAPRSIFTYESCEMSKNQPTKLFDGSNPFVDLHLDFPVKFGKYIQGGTPFFMALQELSGGPDPELGARKMAFHVQRLDQLNYFHDRAGEIKTIIRLYSGNNKQLFKKRVGEFLKQDQGASLKPQDVNASLYQFISFVFLPFLDFGEIKEVVDGFSDLIGRLPRSALEKFVWSLMATGFLGNLQKDCLNIYPEIYNAEMALRPAFFLDLVGGYEKAKTAARISTKDFQSYKDLYKDIIEVFSRQLVILAGINNLIQRGDSESFPKIDGGVLSSMEKFTAKALSDKFKYLDNCFYNINPDAIDAGVRNSIAHNNVNYDEISQIVTYYPKGGGIAQTPGQTIYFLDFMRMVLVLFREMHNLHHMIKALFYLEYLVFQPGREKLATNGGND
ncbi:hypothetical protein [Variovorax sp. CY25R-8]|uniref:hypothetical protein n=1 Tax=Variovorax sp. CY25R-8 TaxID=2855501 RepID=UPI0021BAC18A|nr:hypothetical protein [Variovorax sp. CY25R-8]MCT8174404.1 hypothetical protein [Variovorax sp. CY25R-8]